MPRLNEETGLKMCPTCGEEKTGEEFHKDRTRTDGLQSQCKACVAAYHRAVAHREKVIPTTKVCPTCGEEKTGEEFHKNRTRIDGLDNQCKACKAAHYEANRDKRLAQMAAYHRAVAHREKVIPTTKVCPTCGEEKTGEEFHKNRTRIDGLDNQCKACKAAYHEAAKGPCPVSGCQSACLIDKGGTADSHYSYETCSFHGRGEPADLCGCRHCVQSRRTKGWHWGSLWEHPENRWKPGILYLIRFTDAAEKRFVKIGVANKFSRIEEHLNEGAILIDYVELPRLLAYEIEQRAIAHPLVGDRERLNMIEPVNYHSGWSEVGIEDEVLERFQEALERARYTRDHPDQETVRQRAESRLKYVAERLGIIPKGTHNDQ